MHEFVEKSLSLVTALNPILGYDRAAKLAKEAFESGKTIRKLILENNILTEQELNEVLDYERMTRPGFLFPKKFD
jgi:aspartate ammonia-lyase